MPFIEGRTLESLVEKNGPLDYGLAVNYIGQIANAVGYIHTKNILHRDIKPDNIMITADNHAILIDFGSAREFIQDKTQHQTSILTKGYAPIEQYSSNSRKGAYTDIYSLGAVFYFVLTGQKPMDATERLSEEMPEPRQINPQISEDANRTIMKAMQLKQENRHQTIDEFMSDMLGTKPSAVIPTEKPVTPAEPATVKEKQPEHSNKPLYLSLAVTAVLLCIMGFAVYNHYFVQEPRKIARLKEIYTEETTKNARFIASISYNDNERKLQGPVHGIAKIQELEQIKHFPKTKLKPKSGKLQKAYIDSLKSVQSRLDREIAIERSYLRGREETVWLKDALKRKKTVDRIVSLFKKGKNAQEISETLKKSEK